MHQFMDMLQAPIGIKYPIAVQFISSVIEAHSLSTAA